MSTFTKQEYLDLIRKLADQQYDEPEEEVIPQEIEWIPAESEIKEKPFAVSNEGIIDLTKTKKADIPKSLFKHNNIKVHHYLIRIRSYDGNPTKPETNPTINLFIYHEITQTPLSKAPCKMTVEFHIDSDNRFNTQPWISYFKGYYGKNIPPSVLVDIIYWMQMTEKLSAFL
jgi:hypothetical protein